MTPGAKTDTKEALSRSVAAFWGLAVGDALGATLEFMTASEIQQKLGVHREITGGGWLGLEPGAVTDDTVMSLSLGRTIIDTQRINPYDIAHAFSDWLKSNPIDVGNTVRSGIQHFRITNEPCAPRDDRAAGNGACMRCLPIAIATLGKHHDDVQRANYYQSHITHNNRLSDAATQCVVDMLQMAFNGYKLPDLLEGPVATLIHDFPEFEFDEAPVLNPSGYIVNTIKAVMQALVNSNSFEQCLVDVVNRGGDADTTGAIAGMIAGSLYGADGIPARWLNKLDSSLREDCQNQASELFKNRSMIHISDSNPLI